MTRMKIAVALSGGVDSAVAAYLLQQEGHDVFGLFMKNWEEKVSPTQCLAAQDFRDVVALCHHLGIPYYAVNFSQLYWDKVFAQFLRGIERGLTPNPDILCNREIKFDALLATARRLGADDLATGHYCRQEKGLLLKGKDPAKDQSYFLHAIAPAALLHARFPLGNLTKQVVRQLAKKANLPVAEKKESMGICFIGKRNFRSFLSHYVAAQEGPIETVDGHVVGSHAGALYYTIGQRKGLGIGGEGAPYFVVAKDLKKNLLIVAQGADHPALFAPSLVATDVSWIGPTPTFPFRCRAKIRYRQDDQDCVLAPMPETTKLRVLFDTPQRAITPGQSVVFYRDEVCLGGGVIMHADHQV